MVSRTRRIAIVDDDPGVLRALGRLLRSANFEVEVFSSGSDFLLMKPGLPLDCVLLDLHMPGTTGFDVQAELTGRGSEIPIVIITGDDAPGNRERCAALGAGSYLCKPVDEAALLSTIDSVTGSLDSSAISRS